MRAEPPRGVASAKTLDDLKDNVMMRMFPVSPSCAGGDPRANRHNLTHSLRTVHQILVSRIDQDHQTSASWSVSSPNGGGSSLGHLDASDQRPLTRGHEFEIGSIAKWLLHAADAVVAR